MTLPLRLTGIDPTIVTAIRRASSAAHVDFDYMMAQAAQESSFRPDAKASTSSATGLYQFIDTTWLRAVKQWGAKYGLNAEADAISLRSDGSAAVSDAATRQHILDLRRDPAVAASLAAELAHENKDAVEHDLGRPASPTDLYLAHFLGAHGATAFVREIEANANAKAAELLPQAAAANRSVFYDGAGHAKTVAEIYQAFAQKIEGQAREVASNLGTDTATAAESMALDPSQLPKTGSLALFSMLNVLTETALQLVGRQTPHQRAKPERVPTEGAKRLADTRV